ncbi:MAG TPA: GNAT family N-acetyltransferase [Candidatus Dormibacteraeota bacterium]
MTEPGVTPIVRRLGPDQWRTYRGVRLRALRNAPTAFGSTLAGERGLTEREWRARLASRAQFVATVGSRTVGTAAGIQAEGEGAELISMWVAPRFRGTGVGSQLVSAVLDWALAKGFHTVHLWVAAENLAAERRYARHGFTRTGATQPVTAGRPDRCEFAMARRLD